QTRVGSKIPSFPCIRVQRMMSLDSRSAGMTNVRKIEQRPMLKVKATKNLVLAIALASANFAVAQTEIADAAMARDSETVRSLLRTDADVNGAQADGATALHWAAYHSDEDLVEDLLDAGANPAAANRNGSTPMWLASSTGDTEGIKALLEGEPHRRRA